MNHIMTRLSLSMLGTWQVTLDGEPLTTFESDKVRALLAYLAVESNWPQRRETLAALLWPERPERNARQNLSQALYNLRHVIGDQHVSPPFLNITHHTIQFNDDSDRWLDVTTFTDLLASCEQHQHDLLEACDACRERMQEAVDLYQGEFLAGFSLSDSVTFDEWLFLKREHLGRQVLEALNHLVNAFEGRGPVDAALPYAWRQVELDPWNEKGQQQLIRLLAQSGRRSEALSQYEKCRQLLWDELGVEPAAETQTLYEAVRSEQLDAAGDGLAIRARRRNQLILLDKVETFWVKGVLGESLTGSQLIKITKQRYNSAVERPWDELVSLSADEGKPFPPGKTLGEIFAEADQALLVLGRPGAGKTNALLQLAREQIDQARLDPDKPIPIVLNLASWSEGRPTIAEWVIHELTFRYQIPPRMGRAWLANQELLLLLDGLDEVSGPFREACIIALNRFRIGHGLTGIVVCGRTEAYEACETKLNLGGAVLLRPLTLAQIDAFLGASGRDMARLRSALQNDQTLQELARTPLMLGVMCIIYNDQGAIDQIDAVGSTNVNRETDAAQSESAIATHHRLLQAYVQRALHRRPISSKYSPPQIQKGLTWLAQQMNRHNQSIFLLEQLQPSWLSSGNQRWLYLVSSRLISGFLLGIELWLLFLAMRMLTPRLQSLVDAAPLVQILGGARPSSIFLSFLILNLALGLTVAVLDGWHFERRYGRDDEGRLDPWRGRRQRAVTGLLVGFLAFLYYDPSSQPLLALGSGVMEGVLFTYRSYGESGQSYRTEIGLVEALNWSWTGAVQGLIAGLVVGLPVGILGWQLFNCPFGIISSLGLISIFTLGGGLSHSQIEKRSTPNQGIRLSARNSLLAALIVGPTVGLLASAFWNAPFGLLMGLIYTIGAAMIYGGRQLIQHGLVRILLCHNGRIPWSFVRFLDDAAERALLYKVGGGYIFIHPLLQEYLGRLLLNG